MVDPVFNKTLHVLDQSAAEHRDSGEVEKVEADKQLADRVSRICECVRRVERRIERNRKRMAQGLPRLTLEEQLRLDEEQGDE